MTRRRGDAAKPEEAEAAPLSPEGAVDLICRSFRSHSHWRPSKPLAKCLEVGYQELLVVSLPKDDLSNLVWTTVLVLVYCASHLVDLHESWYEVGDAGATWLRQQQYFLDQREDLVRSACDQLSVRDPDQLLGTLFAVPAEEEPKDDEDALLDEGWLRCYLDEPPYTVYYYNERTSHSTWRHPLETAQMERELQEQRQKREELLAKALAQRLPINRDALPQCTEPPVCEVCAESDTQRMAQVLCRECGDRYFCEVCCDAAHYNIEKRGHLEKGLRFRECAGRLGFPRPVFRPKTPFMLFQEEQKRKLQQQQGRQQELQQQEQQENDQLKEPQEPEQHEKPHEDQGALEHGAR